MVAPLILEHVVDDVEALLWALAEVVYLEDAGGEYPAAVWEAFLPAALVVVAVMTQPPASMKAPTVLVKASLKALRLCSAMARGMLRLM